MTPAVRTPESDRIAIEQVVLRYCRGVDRLDLDLVRSAYHPDGVDHHTRFSGTVDEYLAWVGGALRRPSRDDAHRGHPPG